MWRQFDVHRNVLRPYLGLWHMGFFPHSNRELALRIPLAKRNFAQIMRRQIDPYRNFEITKRDGTARLISAPTNRIKGLQKAILKEYLSNPALAHPNAFAYVKGKSAVQAARVHDSAKWAVKIDIVNFFGSIDEKQIYWTLLSMKATSYQSFVLARVLTRLERRQDELPKSIAENYGQMETPKHKKYLKVQRHHLGKKFGVARRRVGFLPQGAPTSGQVSNLVCFDIDIALTGLASEYGCRYTRYADDIIFSSSSDFSRQVAEEIMLRASSVLVRNGFELHKKKSRIIGPGSKLQILGLLADAPGLRLPPEKKKKIDAELRAIEKFGFHSHAEFLGQHYLKVLNRLFGYLVWASQVEPKWAHANLIRLRQLSDLDIKPGFQG